MPKAPKTPSLPLNGLFPIAKPSGPSSMRVIDRITPLLLDSKLFDDPVKRSMADTKFKRKKNLTHMGLKIGQGGTLDPLADGVLVLGVNRGTKHLNQFLECSKEYESIGLIGCMTTSMDSDDPVLATAAWEHITREDVEKVLDRFRGEIYQVPPIFSALKMDGKPLYEYARESKPLPRPIPTRKCTVSIELVDFTPASVTPGDGGHEYRWPEKRLTAEEKVVFRKLTEIVNQAGTDHASSSSSKPATTTTPASGDQASDAVKTAEETITGAPTSESLVPDLEKPEYPEVSPKTGLRPPTFTVRMTVSSGTYVRSIVHDIGVALGCGAHVVKLTRTRQGEFSLYGDEAALASPSTETASASAVDGAPAAETAVGSAPPATDETPAGPSGGSIPWSVWERALAEREARIEREKAEREEAITSGVSAEEIHTNYSQEALKKKRFEGELAEWENEVLRRFKPVPIPINGTRDFRY
ncbi:tRNA pseudouridine(55) synthase [Kwoniella heveanensis CBS 569]|uniref:tRNA pseudouridine(55) synthase n=1 Tax=Kwoniella heveanensis BCC8398 TaxID=1296120 RepID=A0A1B9GMN5_9TREE|nr:tRNA pseudouridine(55) synthase [Kwoniella heveanensis BCC8398]OCF39068.1 tRNA pseudouridine(55) synthase [Kwoniella heveanensis CBS 569]